MATSTLVQFLDAGESADTSHRRQVETFFAAGSITAGDFVSLDVSQPGADKALFIVQAPATAGDGRVVGVATETATGTAATPAQIRVVVSGYAAGVNVATGSGAGKPLAMSGTAGRATVAQYDPTAGSAQDMPDVFATALTTASGNIAEVMVHKRF